MIRPPQLLSGTRYKTVDGLSIRFAESEPRGVEALLLSPWPESLYAFEPIWSRLAEHARLVAIDLPGFGHSEGRTELFGPRAMGEFLVRVADAFGLELPHVVGPDVGTPAALFAAASHPGRFRSLVVGSAGAVFPLQLGSPLREWIETPDRTQFVGAGRTVVAVALGKLVGFAPSESAREDYLASYVGNRFAESVRYVQAYPEELPALQDLLPRITAPVQIINGRRDQVVPLANAENLHARLPRSRLDVLDAGHFVWEEASGGYAELVVSWWRGGHAPLGTALERDG